MKAYKLTDKIFSQYKKLTLSYILKLFLNFSKFESQYSYKQYSYNKVCISLINLIVGSSNIIEVSKNVSF